MADDHKTESGHRSIMATSSWVSLIVTLILCGYFYFSMNQVTTDFNVKMAKQLGRFEAQAEQVVREGKAAADKITTRTEVTEPADKPAVPLAASPAVPQPVQRPLYLVGSDPAFEALWGPDQGMVDIADRRFYELYGRYMTPHQRFFVQDVELPRVKYEIWVMWKNGTDMSSCCVALASYFQTVMLPHVYKNL